MRLSSVAFAAVISAAVLAAGTPAALAAPHTLHPVNPGDMLLLKNAALGSCLTLNDDRSLGMEPCAPLASSQRWYMDGENGDVVIQTYPFNEACLDSDAQGYAYTNKCNEGANQKWSRNEADSTPASVFPSTATGMCLTTKTGSTYVYTNACDMSDTHQQWNVFRVNNSGTMEALET